MAPFYGWGSTFLQLQSHYEKTVYFLPISPHLSQYVSHQGKCCIYSLCKTFGNELPALNHIVFYNPDFTWMRNTANIVEMPKSWFSTFTQATCSNKCNVAMDLQY